MTVNGHSCPRHVDACLLEIREILDASFFRVNLKVVVDALRMKREKFIETAVPFPKPFATVVWRDR